MVLVTLEEYRKLSPKGQGYIVYMQAEHSGSELKHIKKNPYTGINDKAAKAWGEGQMQAVLEVQDEDCS